MNATCQIVHCIVFVKATFNSYTVYMSAGSKSAACSSEGECWAGQQQLAAVAATAAANNSTACCSNFTDSALYSDCLRSPGQCSSAAEVQLLFLLLQTTPLSNTLRSEILECCEKILVKDKIGVYNES